MSQEPIRDLGDGLILRRATIDDTGPLVAFHADVHRDPGTEEPEEYVGAWVQDLMTRPHPTFSPGDFTVVEDMKTGRIVSSLCLISQTWSYGGVEFGVGRPELVGTHPEYRNQGLIRAQFEVIHEWSTNRGELVQAITGIPWYYRQFGYEMAMTLGGGRAGYKSQVPKLKESEEEPYRLRPATEADLPFLAQVYEHGCRRYPLACVRDQDLWRYELVGKSEKNVNRPDLCVIETTAGESVGWLAHSARLHRNQVGVSAYELEPGVSWLAVTPAVVRYLWALGEEWAAQDPKQGMERFVFFLGAEHPVYEVFRDGLPHTSQPYAWYLRVPDLAGFLRHIAPALEQRLADSLLVGHSGELKLNFCRSGMQLTFVRGKLVSVEPWQPPTAQEGDAAFPDLTFLQLLFGYRSLEELKHAFADCWTANDAARSLLETLFPSRPSDVWPVS
jgi:GNAT superfamily N-acetyltransferase